MRHINANHKNHRQRINILKIFQDLEDLHDLKLTTFQTTLKDNCNDSEFTSLVIIPYFKVKKESNIWNVTLLVSKQLYDYEYPFNFTDYFLTWQINHQFEVKTKIIQVITQKSLKKEMDVEEFLKPFKKLANKKKQNLNKC